MSRRPSQSEILEKKKEQQREARKEQQNFQKEQSALQEAFRQNGGPDRTLIKEILDSDDVTQGDSDDLQEVTITKIKNVLSNNLVLANLTDAQEHDKRFWLEVQKIKVKGAHPPEDSAITGPALAFFSNDEMEELKPLTQQERLLIDDFFETMKDRATRGRGGFERKQINTNISRAETDDEGDDRDGKRGLFG